MASPGRCGRPAEARPLATLATCRPTRIARRSSPSSAPPRRARPACRLDLAERLGGEIVNTDAMQVYRGMDIGTAKLPVAERRGIPHHLLDILDVTRPGDRRAVPGLGARRRSPTSAAAARRRCWSAARRSTPARSSTASSSPAPTRRCARELEDELAERRPAGAARAAGGASTPRRPPGSCPRTGAASSAPSRSSSSPAGRTARQPPAPGVRRPADHPDRRRHRPARPSTRGSRGGSTRCSTAGFVDEVERAARPRASPTGAPRRRAIGYREVIGATSPASCTLAEARERTIVATRRFARRQDSWFRKDPRIVWVALRRPRPGRPGGVGGRSMVGR